MLENFSYCPILFTKNSELKAYEQLLPETKDKIFPLFVVKPLPNAKSLSRVWERIVKITEGRRVGICLDDSWTKPPKSLPAHSEFLNLFDENNGHENYFSLFSSNKNFVPCIQGRLSSEEIENQLKHIENIREDFIVKLTWEKNQYDALKIIEYLSNKNIHCIIYIDLGWSMNLFNRQLWANAILEYVSEHVKLGNTDRGQYPIIETVLSGSSFPDTFASIISEGVNSIYERAIYNSLESKYNLLNLKYGDWASAREAAEEKTIMRTSPRIDLPTEYVWASFRKGEKNDYPDLAERAINSEYWNASLGIWGTNMIKWTSEKDPGSISGQQMAAAVRMNIHMHIQANYGGIIDIIEKKEKYIEDL